MTTFDDFGTFDEGDTYAGYGDMDYGGGFGVVTATVGPTNTEGASFYLELPDGRQLALDSPDLGWYVSTYDMGTPAVREDVEERAMADGTEDGTQFVGARNILIGMTLAGANRQAQLDALGPFIHPRARPELVCRTERWDAYRRIRVRSVGDLGAQWQRPNVLRVGLGFRSVGSPYFTGEERTDRAFPTVDLPGRTYTRSYPRSYPAVGGTGPALLWNRGSMPAEWTARIFGPITGPRLILSNTGQQVVFKDSLVIAIGDYLTVDSTTRTAYLNGSPGASRYSSLDFTLTSPGWFQFEPGQNLVRLTGADALPPAQAEITFRDTYL